jgi:hypothetical protein
MGSSLPDYGNFLTKKVTRWIRSRTKAQQINTPAGWHPGGLGLTRLSARCGEPVKKNNL